jgi:hypothetical protein
VFCGFALLTSGVARGGFSRSEGSLRVSMTRSSRERVVKKRSYGWRVRSGQWTSIIKESGCVKTGRVRDKDDRFDRSPIGFGQGVMEYMYVHLPGPIRRPSAAGYRFLSNTNHTQIQGGEGKRADAGQGTTGSSMAPLLDNPSNPDLGQQEPSTRHVRSNLLRVRELLLCGGRKAKLEFLTETAKHVVSEAWRTVCIYHSKQSGN